MSKRVAIMINCLKFGGAERVMADLSVFLDKNGYEVHLFLMDDTNIAYDYSGTIHKISFGFGILLSLSYFIMTYYYKIKLRINYTISAMEFMNFVNIMTPCNDKIIATMHNYKMQHEITPILKDKFIEWVFTKRVKRTHKIVTVSNAICEKMQKLYDLPKDRFVTIYNATYVKVLEGMAACALPSDIKEFMTPITFVNMSRFVAQKSLDRLLLAFDSVVKKYPLSRLILIGDGEDKEKLYELACYLGIQEKIKITGFLKNPFSIVAKSTAFVLSSHYEGFGNVLVEALCCGKTVISTDCFAGPREILAPGTEKVGVDVDLCEYGILSKFYPDGSGNGVKELAAAMEMVIENPWILEKYEKKAKERAKDFTPDKMYEIWKVILDDEYHM